MEEKKSRKRSKPINDEVWKCSICTFENPFEAYSCEICETRKGTSTRKPKANAAITQQQFPTTSATVQRDRKRGRSVEKTNQETTVEFTGNLPNTAQLPTDNEGNEPEQDVTSQAEFSHETHTSPIIAKPQRISTPRSPRKKTKRPPRHKNIDRSTAVRTKITVNGVTVQFIDYKVKKLEPGVIENDLAVSDKDTLLDNSSNNIESQTETTN